MKLRLMGLRILITLIPLCSFSMLSRVDDSSGGVRINHSHSLPLPSPSGKRCSIKVTIDKDKNKTTTRQCPNDTTLDTSNPSVQQGQSSSDGTSVNPGGGGSQDPGSPSSPGSLSDQSNKPKPNYIDQITSTNQKLKELIKNKNDLANKQELENIINDSGYLSDIDKLDSLVNTLKDINIDISSMPDLAFFYNYQNYINGQRFKPKKVANLHEDHAGFKSFSEVLSLTPDNYDNTQKVIYTILTSISFSLVGSVLFGFYRVSKMSTYSWGKKKDYFFTLLSLGLVVCSSMGSYMLLNLLALG